MLQIHSKYSELIKDIFQNDQEFLSALDKACSTCINFRTNQKIQCKSPELVNFSNFPLLKIFLIYYQFINFLVS
jgi:hypothetical protein